MNTSLKDIWFWIVSLDFPSLSMIWQWLITVPWWLALITLIGFWWVAKTLLAICWNSYRWYQYHLPRLKFRFRRLQGMLKNLGRILRGKRAQPLPEPSVGPSLTTSRNENFPDVLVFHGGKIKPVTFWAKKWLWANTNNNCPSFDDMPDIIDVAGDVEDLLKEMTGTGFVIKDKRKLKEVSANH
jgi:hypothetical protein